MHLSVLYPQVIKALKNKGIEEGREAQQLITAALGWTSLVFFEYLRPAASALSSDHLEKIEAVLNRRLHHEPLSRIMGMRGFWKDVFSISPSTLDPRPETEGIIEQALSFFAHQPPPEKILDLGTGTGCLLLSLLQEFPGAWGIGVDIQKDAIVTAQQNAQHLGLAQRLSFVAGHWMDMFSSTMCFDLIVANPPYIPTREICTLAEEVKRYDPLQALDGGQDGLACYRALLPATARHLSPQGCVIVEIGGNQASSICALAQGLFPIVQVHQDLSGKARYILNAYTLFKK